MFCLVGGHGEGGVEVAGYYGCCEVFSSNLMIVRRGGNQVGRFLEVSSFTASGRKGSIWLPKGQDGRGWRRFVGELSKMVAVLESPSGLLVGAVATLDQKICVPFHFSHNFVELLWL